MKKLLACGAVWLTTVAVLTSVAPVRAQHETAADLLDGERAFRNSCAVCHGPDGDLIPNIDLGRGRFRRPMADADLVRIIRNGIAGTPMPPTPMSEMQAQQIVSYLRARAATATAGTSLTGDVSRGQAVYAGKGACASCHRIDGTGSRVGPNLSTIGAVRGAAELERALVEPNADVQPQNRSYRVVLKDGTVVEGRLLGHDTFSVQLLDTGEQLRSFVKSDLRESGFVRSPMPSYRGTLTPQELADVVAYLGSLKGR